MTEEIRDPLLDILSKVEQEEQQTRAFHQRPEPKTAPITFTMPELAALRAALIRYRTELASVDLSQGVDWEIELHNTVVTASGTAAEKIEDEITRAQR